MKNNWKETTLKEILKIRNGKSRPENGSKYPVYGGNGILGYADEYNVDAETIIIGRVGAYCGSVFLENNKFWLSDNALGINSNQYSDIKYLYYLLKNLNLNRNAIGGAQPLLTQGVLYQIEIRLPKSIDEQKAIAKILSSLDDKIELLREQNKTLEATAQMIFKEWFVNFNFPDENGKSYKEAGGKMIDSELGEIPDGWRVGKLGEAIELFDSKRVPLASDVRAKRKGEYPYYGATTIMDYIDDYIFEGTYLLLAEDGSVIDEKGHPILQYVHGQFWVSNHAHVLQGKNGFSTEILYVLMQRANVAGIVNGAVQLKINKSNLINFEIVIPLINILKMFDNVLQPILNKITDNNSQIQKLAKTRDALLPKLMSGEVTFN